MNPRSSGLRRVVGGGGSWPVLGTVASALLCLAWALLSGLCVQAQQACIQHITCRDGRFCNNVPINDTAWSDGFCEGCWKCCLHPERYDFPVSKPGATGLLLFGNCTQRCNCNRRGGFCFLNTDCGLDTGMFCMTDFLATDYYTAVGTCQPCTRCFTDSAAVDPLGCSAACPAGPLSGLIGQFLAPDGAGGLPTSNGGIGLIANSSVLSALIDAVVDLSFDVTASVAEGSDMLLLSAEEVEQFLRRASYLQGSNFVPTASGSTNASTSTNLSFVPEVLSNIYASTHAGGNSSLPLVAIATVLSGASRSIFCPKLDAMQPVSRLPRLSRPGCPCNYAANASHSLCPAGYICSRQAFRGLPSDDPAWTQLRAACVPCVTGQYCGEGTTTIGLKNTTLDCPAGSYCPTPGEIYPCPEGYYCSSRAIQPASCTDGDVYGWLLIAAADTAGQPSNNATSIARRLRDGNGPIKGNYCPQNSTTPNVKCPEGHYCPNASVKILCEAGHFCKPQSTYQVPCPPLASCPAGTAYPNGKSFAGLLFGMIVLGTCLVLLLARAAVRAAEVIVRHSAVLSSVQKISKKKDGSQGRREELEAGPRATLRSGGGLEMDSPPPENKDSKAEQNSGLVKLLLGEAQKAGVTSYRLDIEFVNVTGRFLRNSADKNNAAGGNSARLGGVGGSLEAGKVNVIMGPSGCGKSSLIKMLSGRSLPAKTVSVQYEETTGVVLSASRYRRKLGYVPQEDVLHPTLTVRENLEYSACLMMRPDTPALLRHEIVYEVLRSLQIHHRPDRIVGPESKSGTSGGERKRVNIGMGIVALPPVLILDEPTSGLDASTSMLVVQLMLNLARNGNVNVITVLHQPRFDSFIMFDRLLLLGNDGMVVYEGHPKDCEKYFKSRLGFRLAAGPTHGDATQQNFADFILDLTSGVKMGIASTHGIDADDLAFTWLLHETKNPNARKPPPATYVELQPLDEDPVRKDKAWRIYKALEMTGEEKGPAMPANGAPDQASLEGNNGGANPPPSQKVFEAEFEKLYSEFVATLRNPKGGIFLVPKTRKEVQLRLEKQEADELDRVRKEQAVAAANAAAAGALSRAPSGALSRGPGSRGPSFLSKTGSLPQALSGHFGSFAGRVGSAVSVPDSYQQHQGLAWMRRPVASAQSEDRRLPGQSQTPVLEEEDGEGAVPDLDAGSTATPAEAPEANSTAAPEPGVRSGTQKRIRRRAGSVSFAQDVASHTVQGKGGTEEITPMDAALPTLKSQGSHASVASRQQDGVSGQHNIDSLTLPRPAAGSTRPEDTRQPQSGATGEVALSQLGVPQETHSPQWRFSQLCYLIVRNLQKSTRVFWVTVMDVCVLLSAAFIVGTVQGTKWDLDKVPANATMEYLVQGVLAAVVHLRVFTSGRHIQRHECEVGVSATSTFLSCFVTDLGWICLAPAVFLSVYYHVIAPRASFAAYYVVSLLVCWWCSGLAYVVSLSFIHAQAQFIVTVVVILVLGAFLHGLSPKISSARGSLLEVVLGLSYNRWAMEALTIQEMKMYMYRRSEIISMYYDIGICRVDEQLPDDNSGSTPTVLLVITRFMESFNADSCDRYFTQACVVLFCMGLAWRIIAFLQLVCDAHWKRIQVTLEHLYLQACSLISMDGGCACWTVLKTLYTKVRDRLTMRAMDKMLRKWVGMRYPECGLWAAVKNDKLELVEALLQVGGDLELQDEDDPGYTVLHEASRLKSAEVLKLLLNNKRVASFVNMANQAGDTPLHLACSGNDHMGRRSLTVCQLLSAGANVDTRNKFGCLPIHLAAGSGDHESVSQLLQHKPEHCTATIEPRNQGGDHLTVLDVACDSQRVAVIDVLLRSLVKEEPADRDRTPLHRACIGGYDNAARVLIDADQTDITRGDKDGNQPIHFAAASCNIDIVVRLLEVNAGLVKATNKEGRTPIHIAREEENAELLGTLLQAALDGKAGRISSKPQESPILHLAVEAAARRLFDEDSLLVSVAEFIGQQPGYYHADENGDFPLHLAASYGLMSFIKMFLEKVRDSSTHVNKAGYTPLHAACSAGQRQAAVALLGADRAGLEVKTKEGFTPLHAACGVVGNLHLVETLLASGARLDATTKNGTTALQLASELGDLAILSRLYTAGADPAAKNQGDYTALHFAAKRGNLRVLKALLLMKADPNAAGQMGWTPLHVACLKGYEGVVQALLEAGADQNISCTEEDIPVIVGLSSDSADKTDVQSAGLAAGSGSAEQAPGAEAADATDLINTIAAMSLKSFEAAEKRIPGTRLLEEAQSAQWFAQVATDPHTLGILRAAGADPYLRALCHALVAAEESATAVALSRVMRAKRYQTLAKNTDALVMRNKELSDFCQRLTVSLALSGGATPPLPAWLSGHECTPAMNIAIQHRRFTVAKILAQVKAGSTEDEAARSSADDDEGGGPVSVSLELASLCSIRPFLKGQLKRVEGPQDNDKGWYLFLELLRAPLSGVSVDALKSLDIWARGETANEGGDDQHPSQLPPLIASKDDDAIVGSMAAAAKQLACRRFQNLVLEQQLMRWFKVWTKPTDDEASFRADLSEVYFTKEDGLRLHAAREAITQADAAPLEPAPIGSYPVTQERFQCIVDGLCASTFLQNAEPVAKDVRAFLGKLGIMPVRNVTESGERYVPDSSGGPEKDVYAKLKLPRRVVGYEVASIQVTAESHDQGWSSYPWDHGTYNNTWSWCELRVVGPGGEPVIEDKEGRLFSNRHAVRIYQTHNAERGPESDIVQQLNELLRKSNLQDDGQELRQETAEQHDWKASSSGGDEGSGPEVQLLMCAAFPGWECYVRKATITLQFRGIRRWRQ